MHLIRIPDTLQEVIGDINLKTSIMAGNCWLSPLASSSISHRLSEKSVKSTYRIDGRYHNKNQGKFCISKKKRTKIRAQYCRGKRKKKRMHSGNRILLTLIPLLTTIVPYANSLDPDDTASYRSLTQIQAV